MPRSLHTRTALSLIHSVSFVLFRSVVVHFVLVLVLRSFCAFYSFLVHYKYDHIVVHKGVEVMEKKKNELRTKIAALRKQLEKVQKSIGEDRSSSNKVTYMVDQGGGSFTAYVFAPGANELAKIKSSKNPELLDVKLMAKFKRETGINLYNTDDGVHKCFIIATSSCTKIYIKSHRCKLQLLLLTMTQYMRATALLSRWVRTKTKNRCAQQNL